MAKTSFRRPAAALLCSGGLLASAGAAAAQAPSADCGSDARPRLHVTIEGLRSAAGDVVVELYPDDPSRFLARDGRVGRVRQKARLPVTEACISAPAPGIYALVMYHDQNDDQVFNRSGLGLPTEGFGFSNDVKPVLGPPSLKSVRFAIPAGESSIRVKMRYLFGDRG